METTKTPTCSLTQKTNKDLCLFCNELLGPDEKMYEFHLRCHALVYKKIEVITKYLADLFYVKPLFTKVDMDQKGVISFYGPTLDKATVCLSILF